MNWMFTMATIIVAAAIALRLLWWAYGRSHQSAAQGQSAAGNPTESNQTGQTIEADGQVPVAVEAQSRKK